MMSLSEAKLREFTGPETPGALDFGLDARYGDGGGWRPCCALPRGPSWHRLLQSNGCAAFVVLILRRVSAAPDDVHFR
jgi:hypothetical protein